MSVAFYNSGSIHEFPNDLFYFVKFLSFQVVSVVKGQEKNSVCFIPYLCNFFIFKNFDFLFDLFVYLFIYLFTYLFIYLFIYFWGGNKRGKNDP